MNNLSPRELDVLAQLKQGHANKIIAHNLAISLQTVKVHVRAIMKKFEASNRVQVVIKAMERETHGV